MTFFNSQGHHEKAVEIGERLRGSPAVDLIHVSHDLFVDGWAYMRDRSDKRYSLTDCLSFVVMERRGIDSALAFDRHFEQAGFQCLPATD